MSSYKLDPLHYYTAPGLSWDALLKHTKIDLELLTDMDMHLFIEKGMRGGISMVSKRHAKANNPLLLCGSSTDIIQTKKITTSCTMTQITYMGGQ